MVAQLHLKPQKILLTGANGFTGRWFTAMGKDAGHDIVALNADLMGTTLEAEVLKLNPDAVVHLAGISFVASKDQEAFYRVHALGTSRLLEALSKLPQPPKKVLLASSATVYGNVGAAESSENQALSPIDHYAISKVAMEEMAKTFFHQLPIVIVRPFNYTGPGQKPNFLIPKLITHFAEKKASIELGNLNIEREFNSVKMICAAYFGLLQFGAPGEIYNVSSGRAHSLQFVLDSLIKLTGHTPQIRVNPDFVRASEVRRMCGSPQKLISLLQAHGVLLPIISLESTLEEMLLDAKK